MYDVDLCTPLTDERRGEVIDSIARKIVGRHLETPAVLFLDMHKPLSFVASQAMLVGLPFLGVFFGAQPVADISKLLKDRENVEALIERIEEMSAENDDKDCHADPELNSGDSVSKADCHADPELDSGDSASKADCHADPELNSGDSVSKADCHAEPDSASKTDPETSSG
jgi:hypothetical protein